MDAYSGLCAHVVDLGTEGYTEGLGIIGVFLDPENDSQLPAPDLLGFFLV